jgi:hypothetical protein
MRHCLQLFLVAALSSPGPAAAQIADDTLPGRVVARAYEAFNRHDASAYMSLFAPRIDRETVWPDSLCGAVRTTREEEEQRLAKKFAPGGVYYLTRESARQQLVAGPFVVVEEVVADSTRGTIHLYLFEVRHGLITRTLAFDAYDRAPPLGH